MGEGEDYYSMSMTLDDPHDSSHHSSLEDAVASWDAVGRSRSSLRVTTCREFVKNHKKATALCVFVSVGVAATIGVMLALLPVWMASDAEELVAGSNNEMGNSGVVYGSGVGYSLESAPHNLEQLCSKESRYKPGGHDKCISACLPSRCCLVPEGKPHELWIPRVDVGGGSSSSTASASLRNVESKEAETENEIITSCYSQNQNTCKDYHKGCSVLGAHTLLPRKPPTIEDVSVMEEKEKLDLAEWIIHSCSDLRSTRLGFPSLGTSSECEMLCQEKECCFADDDINISDSQEEEGSTENSLDNGGDKDGEETKTWADNSAEKKTPYFENAPSAAPTPGRSSTLVSSMPTSRNSSYKPTAFGSFDKRYKRQLLDDKAKLSHISIPGEEDFVYVESENESVASDPYAIKEESTTSSTASSAAASSSESYESSHMTVKYAKKNCVNNPRKYCAVYAGCAPLFEK